MDLFTEGQQKMKILDQTLSDLGRRGKAYAQAEKDYRMALAKRLLIERNNKMPTTILVDVCKGHEEVAALKFERDCTEAYYKTCLEGINVLKLEIKMLESQLDRE
jgi:hypothetical protein